jgi:hypothetical protein
MVEAHTTDGVRIARLLASEIHGHESGPLGELVVADANTGVEPTEYGAFAYGIDFPDGSRLAEVFVHPDRAHVELREGVDVAAAVAGERGLRVRPKAVQPPRTLVFVESGAEVKRILYVLKAVIEAAGGGQR